MIKQTNILILRVPHLILHELLCSEFDPVVPIKLRITNNGDVMTVTQEMTGMPNCFTLQTI